MFLVGARVTLTQRITFIFYFLFLKNNPICFHCGAEKELKTVDGFFPICEQCIGQKRGKVPRRGKKVFTPKAPKGKTK